MIQDPSFIYDALESSLSEWRPNEQIPLKFLRFPYGFSKIGDVIECSLADEIDYRQQFVDKPLPKHRSGDAADRKMLQPLEVGIVVETFEMAGKFKGNRKVTDVVGVTWIVVDCDSGVGGKPIVEKLQELGVAYIYAESSTSRLNGDGVGKWHLFLPLAQPKMLPDRRGVDVAAVESAQAASRWWGRVHSHVVDCLFALGGIGSNTTSERKDDASLDRIVQGAFVPHRPDGSPPRFLSFPQQGSRCLVLDDFLVATGFEDLSPPLIHIDEVERPQPLPDRTTDEPSPDDGATPGETPGSLAYRALYALGLVGDYEPTKGGYEVLCPWRDSHNSAVVAGTQDNFSNSTMVFMGSGKAGSRSGFHCFHNGCAATAGMGAAVSTSEILKFARSRGVSSEALPDRTAWAGSTALVGVMEAEPAMPPPPPTLVTPFVLAPVATSPTTQPAPTVTLTLPDRKARAVIPIDEDRLAEMIDAGIAALSKHPRIFKASGTNGERLVDLLEVPGAVPYVRAASAITLAPELQKVSKWVVPSPKVLDDAALMGVAPHAKTVASILHAGHYPGIREIRGVVTAPTFHSDGLVVQTPGYNASMAVYYHPIDRVPLISEDPSQEMLLAAKGLLVGNVPTLRPDDDVLADFPFKKGTELLCRSVWLAGILTRLMRHTFKGNIPFFLVSAGDRSSGKGKLIDAAALISDGVFSESISFSASDDENERIIGMFMQSAAPVVHVDNVRGTLSSTKYEAYSTTPNFSTRSIGTSSKITKTKQEGIVDTTVWFSGNGLTTGGDMSRRGLRIDIEDTTGTPGSRVVRPGWEGLTPKVKESRPQLLGAALTLISGFFAARRRGYRFKLPLSFASFDEWSIVREVIVWMGLPDPVLAVGGAGDDDVDSLHGHILQHLREIGCEEKEMLQSDIVKKLIADNATRTPQWGGFYAFLSEQQIDMTRPGPASQQLGTWLRSQGYVGRTLKAADGRRWKLVKRRASGGTVLTVREMKS